MRFLVFLASLACATSAVAQTSTNVETPKALLGIEGKYGALQRAGAGVELFLPVQKWHCGDGLCGGRGIEVQASAATGGWQVAAGPVLMAFPFWFDLLAMFTRTSMAPGVASPESSYVGVAAGLAFPIYTHNNQFLSLRPSIGVARRIDGLSGPDQTTFTWSVGVNYVWPKF